MQSSRFLLPLALLASAPAAAQTEWRQSRDFEVLLSSFDIEPQTIRLKAGEPLRLRLVNNSTIPHSFSAPEFFGRSEIRSRDRQSAADGKIEVAPGDAEEILLVPKAGRYSAGCPNLYHWVLGMRSRIIVE